MAFPCNRHPRLRRVSLFNGGHRLNNTSRKGELEGETERPGRAGKAGTSLGLPG